MATVVARISSPVQEIVELDTQVSAGVQSQARAMVGIMQSDRTEPRRMRVLMERGSGQARIRMEVGGGSITVLHPEAGGQAHLYGSSATFVISDVARIRYRAYEDQLKQEIWLDAYPGINVFTEHVWLDGLTIEQQDGTWVYKDAEGAVVAYIAPLMVKALHAMTGEAQHTLADLAVEQQADGSYLYRITVDDQWLRDRIAEGMVVVIDPTTVVTTTSTANQPYRAIDRFSDGTRMMLWHNGTTTVFRTSVDGVTWLDPVTGGDFGLPGKNLVDAYLLIRNNVVYVAAINATDNREVLLFRGTTPDKRNFEWTRIQIAAGVSGYGGYAPQIMTPYLQGSELRIPVGWVATGSGYSEARFRVVNEVSGTMTAQANTYTTSSASIDSGYRRAYFGIDANKNVHCVYRGSSRSRYVRWPNTGTDTWGSAVSEDLETYGVTVIGVMLTGGNRFLLIKSSEYQIRDTNGTIVQSGYGPSAPGINSGGMEADHLGNAILYKCGDGSEAYIWDGMNQYWRRTVTLQAQGTTWNRLSLTVDEGTGEWDLAYLQGAANPYSVMYDKRTGRTSPYPALMNVICPVSYSGRQPQIHYLPDGDAVVMYWDPRDNKWKFAVLQNDGRSVKHPSTGATLPTAQTGEAWFCTGPDGSIHVLVNTIPVGSLPSGSFTDKLYYCRGVLDANKDNITWVTTDLLFHTCSTNNIVWNVFMVAFPEGNGQMIQAVWDEFDNDISGTQYGRFRGVWIDQTGAPALQAMSSLFSATRSGVMEILYAIFDPATKQWWILFDDPTNPLKEARATYTPGSGGNPGSWSWSTGGSPTYPYTNRWGHRMTQTGSKLVYLGTGVGSNPPVGIYFGTTTKTDLPGSPLGNDVEKTAFALEGTTRAHVLWVTKDGNLWVSRYQDGAGWHNTKAIMEDVSWVEVGQYFLEDRFQAAIARLGYSSAGPLVALRAQGNAAPFAPTIIVPPAFDAADGVDITSTLNEPNSGDTLSGVAYKFVYTLPGGGIPITKYWDATAKALVDYEVKNPASGTSHTIPAADLAGLWPVGTVIQVFAKHWDQAGEPGPYNTIPVWTKASTKPVITAMSPAEDEVIEGGRLTVQASASTAPGTTTAAYEVTLLSVDELTILSGPHYVPMSGSLIYEVPYQLQNQTAYKVRVRATDSDGLQGSYVTRSFTVDFVAPNAVRNLYAFADPVSAAVRLRWSRDEAGVTQPDIWTGAYEVFRDGIRIALVTNPATGDPEYVDRAVASGKVYTYSVRATGNNGTAGPDVQVEGSVAFEGWRFTPIDDPAGEVPFRYDWSSRRQRDEDRRELVTRGRYPITFRGPSKPFRLSITARFSEEDGLTPQEWAERIYALSGTLGYLRGPDGGIWYGELYAPQDQWERDMVLNARVISVQFVEKGPVPVQV